MIVKCKLCTDTTEVEGNLSPQFSFICKRHSDETPHPDPSCQFDIRWCKRYYKMPFGYQPIIIETAVSTPEWSTTDEGIQRIILKAFPRWETDEVQYYRAGRWARMMYLAYRLQYTISQIAAEMDIDIETVFNIWRRVQRVADDKRASGQGKRTRR